MSGTQLAMNDPKKIFKNYFIKKAPFTFEKKSIIYKIK